MVLNNKNKGFTIVELLIVIVVIGILAAISIVSYTGIQDRARNTTVADAASQIKGKIETWNSVNGSYPTAANFGTLTTGKLAANTAALVSSAVPEAEIPADIASKMYIGSVATLPASIPTNHSGASPIYVGACAGGATIVYFETGKTSTTYPKIVIGSGC